MQLDISISIINTNNRDITLQCLRSIYETAGDLNLEVFVVNNYCQDDSNEAIRAGFPQVKTIDNDRILGFSTNNNLVFSQANGRNLLLLNDDTILRPGSLQKMLTFMDKYSDVGVVGANLINPDESSQKSYDRSPHPLYDGLQPISEWLVPLPSSNGAPLEVGYVCGACMLVRGEAAKKVGLLDTSFDPLYSEEVDWCFRIQKAGWKIYHLPEALVVHFGGSTMNRMPTNRYQRIFEKKALFFRKHYSPTAVAIYKSSLLSINLIKVVIWGILALFGKSGARAEIEIHWNMVRCSLLL
jgi:GT2 family glycosyltransferase